jgi:CBS domain-containing protein
MQAKDVMTPTTERCAMHTSLTDVARLMRDRSCTVLPVVNPDEADCELVGIITDRDIVVRAVADGADPRRLSAGDCMSLVVSSVTPETSLEDCESIIEEHLMGWVPVVDNQGRCCGLVTQADLSRHARTWEANEMSQEFARLGQPPIM